MYALPVALINIFLTGVPLYFIVEKTKNKLVKTILLFFLMFIDYFINMSIYNVQDSNLNKILRIALFLIALLIYCPPARPRMSRNR